MANGQKFTLTFDAQLNVNQMKGALSSIQSELSKLKLPANISKGLQDTFDKLSSEVKNFENISAGGINSKNDLTKLEASANKVLTLYEKLQSQAKSLGNLSSSQLEKLFPENVIKNIEAARSALKGYADSAKAATKDLEKANAAVEKINSSIAAEQGKTTVTTGQYKQISEDLKAAETEVDTYKQKIEELTARQKQMETDLTAPKKSSKYRDLIKELEEVRQKYEEASQKAKELSTQKASVTTNEKQAEALAKLNGQLTEAQQKANAAVEALRQIESVEPGGGVQQLIQVIGQLTGLDMSKFSNDVNGAAQALQTYLSNALNDTTGNLRNFNQVIEQNHAPAQQMKTDADECVVANQRLNDSLQEVQAVKKRIQYFFGLQNTINLVKRAIRGAFDTIKELDKAMTETAVVTDFSVSDMWAQLPEYTKRANELGVTTLAAYQAATLYYQQGLKTNEVNALSVETLKMARIAGLDAAEATDRMTNALRGFNMALTEANAQRVDDVYSELAANTASNVDEISTAMTKVASLANNANMEFETTAAFLAQIIETTRESAETAGTALKTVVARFSEVKKLVDEGTLRGTDEEGQVVDVNKVSAALRTAGIDMNKYFLGEVGLDDIFMELASKWDSLTNLQQRYIATQAAGSRQQSRFIALMSDYARTQELVGKAYNANGAAARQFAKTQESLESKLARLKNAWNEFLMGLTNNQMVKGFVDSLTNLLNFLNKLTNGFDATTNSILKLGVALGGLAGGRALLKSGGLVDTALLGLTKGTGVGNLLQNLGLVGGEKGPSLLKTLKEGILDNRSKFATADSFMRSGQMGAQGAAGFVNGNLSGLSKIFYGLGSKVSETGLGGKLAGSKAMASLGEIFGGLGTQAGAAATAATGLATALGAVAIAVGAIVAGYQLWLHLTPEGQLKQAKAIAEAMNITASNTQHAAEELKKASEAYEEYNDAVKNAKTVEDRNEAIQNRNEYIQSLLEQNEALAKYVTTSQEGGQFVLTINEEELAAAAKTASEGAAKAVIGANFANALQAGKQADVFDTRLQRAGVDLENRTIRQDMGDGTFVDRQLTDAEYAKYAQYAQAAAEQRSQQRSFAAQAYQQDLADTGLKDDVATMLAGALADAFDEDKYLKDINDKRSENWWSGQATRKQLEADYLDLYGVQADASMERDLARAVAQGQVDKDRSANTKELAELIQGDKAESYKALLEAWTGTGKMAEINLEGQSFEDILSQLGFSDLTQDELAAFAEALGTTTDKLGEHIAAVVEDTKKIQAQARANVFETMIRAGMTISTEQQALINGMTPAQIEQINTTAGAAEGLLSPEDYQQLISDLISGTIDESFATQLTELFSSINLDDPIGAFHELADAKEEAAKVGNQDLVNYIDKIQQANESLFTASNLVQSFIVSAGYEEITDQLGEFIEENGRISAKNIEELASSNSKLKQLLDSNIVSAKGLANALTLIEQGKLNFDQLTDAMLKALDTGESFAEVLEDVQSWIEDFDEGTDLKLGTEHIVDELANLQEYVDNWEFGNEPTQKIYDHIFGERTYQQLVERFGNDFEAFERFVDGKIADYTHMAENAGLGGIQAATAAGITGLKEIAGSGGQFFEWDLSQFSSTTEAINQVASALGVSQEAAEAFILSWQSHMPALRTEWDQLNFETQLQTYIENLGDARIATEQELIALGATVDETGHVSAEKLQEIIDKINEARAQAGKAPIEIPVIVNWQDESGTALSGEDLLNQYRQQFGTGETIQLDVPYEVLFNGITYQRNALYEDVDSAFADLQQYINAEANTIDIDGVLENLTSKGLSDAQAAEVAQEFVSELSGALLQRTIEVPELNADGAVEMVERTVTGTDLSALEANINAEFEAANAQLVAQKLANADYSGVSDSVGNAAETGVYNGAISGWNSFVSSLQPISIPVAFTGGIVSGATGGIVKSLASGTNNSLSPGFALTGEEGPEIIWNKNAGYAYVTGRNGPEFQNLQPGDRVFNAAETSRIFRNSSFARGGIFDSYAAGGWKPTKPSGGGNSSSSSGNTKKESTWRNELDWLYDLMEDIAEYERQQTILQSKYDLALKDITATGRNLFKLTQKELINLETQLDAQEAAQLKRLQQMGELQTQVNAAGYGKYVQYNQKDQTLEINWDKIEAIKNKDTYDEVTDWISRMENVQDQMDDAEKAIWDIRAQIQELQDRYLQSYLDFQQKVLNAVVKQYQDTIDSFSDLNSTLNDTNSAILDSIQKEIDLERQIRDNTDTEKNIADMEARLAYLQRDTTGANAVEIRQLQQQLADARESYSDTLIDQSIDRLSEANDAAAQQREKQIELMQAQLDYWQESGGLWGEVAELISTGFTQEGTIIQGSDLWEILQNADSWGSLSEAQKKNWANELILEANEVGAHLIQLSGGNDINFSMIRDSIADVGGLLTQDIRAVADEIRSLRTGLTGKLGGTPQHSYTAEKVEGYASGGLNTKTGPTLLHGTPSEPEYVLNARQTDAFLRLADVLPGVFNTSNTITNTYGGNSTFNVEVNVGSISDDYDVDSLVARIKEDLYDAASYRNGNPLGFLR